INQNQALFSLLGTTFGGDGMRTFGLPNLQGRVPTHQGNGLSLGQMAGEQTHTLGINELPAHTHLWNITTTPGSNVAPTGGLLGAAQIYNADANPATVAMHPSQIGNAGGSQPHENMQPYLVLNFIIALQGIFPSQT
ncbi:MAG: phage tail protein, partial [Proteobacteria bacterium]